MVPDIHLPHPAPEKVEPKRVDAPEPPPPAPSGPIYLPDSNGVWNFTKSQEQAIREYQEIEYAHSKLKEMKWKNYSTEGMTKIHTKSLDQPGAQKQRKHQGTTLTVHIVPYSNQNVSPLKNLDSQYAGQENRDGDPMTRAMIIFPQVVDRLILDPSKTFATDAVKFAHMWYTRASKSYQKKFKKLV